MFSVSLIKKLLFQSDFYQVSTLTVCMTKYLRIRRPKRGDAIIRAVAIIGINTVFSLRVKVVR